ncbi:MAG: TM2 domain-containing protein [Muribaculaceae bacterium]|nr:TM2 domain-containing protein [Muribaculaceae bacterium]
MKKCPRCGTSAADNAQFCSNCGSSFNTGYQPNPGYSRNDGFQQSSTGSWQRPPYVGQSGSADNCFDSYGPEGKSRGVAALLAILLGGFGAQYFYIGKVTAGILSIVISVISCGLWNIVTLIQGIYMFTITNEQFRQKYVATTAQFPVF